MDIHLFKSNSTDLEKGTLKTPKVNKIQKQNYYSVAYYDHSH